MQARCFVCGRDHAEPSPQCPITESHVAKQGKVSVRLVDKAGKRTP
jgi:hypothetical protein